MKKRYLVLQNNTVFEGCAIGKNICTNNIGELVFTTGMCGYIETLTDPSYYGQIIVQTFPLIGNYGIIPDDYEGKCFAKGYIVNEECELPSNFRCKNNLDEFLCENNVAGISGVDTRYLTQIIRDNGVMNAMITDTLPNNIEEIKNYKIINSISMVSRKKEYTEFPLNFKYRVALLDFGVKNNIIKNLVKRCCEVTILPYDTEPEKILNENFDGVLLSNGPGDPVENKAIIRNIKNLIGKIPIFGICLGHQLLALAMGGNTYKLKYGHRGVNQPVTNTKTNRTYITSQNHGYAVNFDSLDCGEQTYFNANDKTSEGIEYKNKYAFSVQFHPEACSGPKDTEFLFDEFCSLMEDFKNANK